MARILTGLVVSNKATKTIVVSVASSKTHPLYQKKYTIGKRFMVHDEKEQAEVGDKVTITECRPLSARKRHTLSAIVEKAAIREKDLVENVTAEPELASSEAKGEQPDSRIDSAAGALQRKNSLSKAERSEAKK